MSPVMYITKQATRCSEEILPSPFMELIFFTLFLGLTYISVSYNTSSTDSKSWEEEDEDNSTSSTETTNIDTTNIETETSYPITNGSNITEFLTNETVNSTMKNILLWTYNENFVYKMEEMEFLYSGGQQLFIDKKCPYINCYVTVNRSYIDGDIRKFDAIVFLAPDIFSDKLPQKRAPHQKYIFATMESSDNYPVCNNAFNGFFNWTWTYRVDSDARWGYIYVRDSKTNIIGPKKDMHWIAHKDMTPIGNKLKSRLRSKTRAAAWFVSNCWTRSRREDFVKKLRKELSKYDLAIDIYGECAEWECGKHRHAECLKMLEKDYFFYLAFENGLSEDYVTETLLHPLQSNTVPIVFGGANYSRFMPDGMYLNARQLGVKMLASMMSYLMLNPKEYDKYFRWKNHYSFHDYKQLDLEGYCRICTMLNEENLQNKTTVYTNFKGWWNPPDRC